LDSALRDCSRSSSQLVLHPSHLMRNTVICDTVAMLHPQDHLRPSASFVFPSTPTQYVRCDLIQFLIIFSENMVILFILSSVLEFCMLVFIHVICNLIQNLILQLSISPTHGIDAARVGDVV